LNSVRDRLGTAVTGDGNGHRDASGSAAGQHAAGRADKIATASIHPRQVLLAGASIGLHYSCARAEISPLLSQCRDVLIGAETVIIVAVRDGYEPDDAYGGWTAYALPAARVPVGADPYQYAALNGGKLPEAAAKQVLFPGIRGPYRA
jgi:hypothetical protein